MMQDSNGSNDRMPVVHVVQAVMRRNARGDFVPAHDLSAACKYGELDYLFDNRAVSFAPALVMNTLRHKLKDFSDADYLLPVGDPVLMMAAAVIAANNNRGRVNILKWDGRSRDYMGVTIDRNNRRD